MAESQTAPSRALAPNWREAAFGPHGTYSQAWADYLGTDPMMQRVRMAVEVVLGGSRRMLLCSEPTLLTQTILTASGRTYAFVGLLQEEPQIEASYGIGEPEASQRSVQITMGIPDIDPWEIIMRDQRVVSGHGQITLIAPGIAWEDRFVLLTGDMVGGVTFGPQGESIQFTLQDPTITVDLGVTEYVVDQGRFPLVPPEFVGMRIPLAINASYKVPCIRVVLAPPPTFVVCFGHDYDVDLVWVNGEPYIAASTVYPWSAVRTTDARGVPVTTIVFSGGIGIWADTDSVHADISPTDGRREQKDVIGTARELADDWSLTGHTTLNADAFSRARARVPVTSAPAIFINGSDAQTAARALEYIEKTICASFPMISMTWQPGGYGPVVTDRTAAPVGKWIVGQGVIFDRASTWEETPKDALRNRFTLRYGYNAVNDTYDGVLERNATNSALCRLSEQQLGPRDDPPRESTIIPSVDLATWVIDWLVGHFSLPHYVATYSGEPAILLRYRLGDNVELVDPEIWGSTSANPTTATILGITYTRGRCQVTLAIWALHRRLPGGAT